jgi:NAD(P)-dependent dehydrogenase (short-subunit alcohol dehydrogenase family)
MSADLFSLAGRTVLVTGATGGIGQMMADTAYGAGADLVLTGREGDAADELRAAYPEALVLAGDLTDADFRGALVDRALERYGRIDVLANNAGVPATDRCLDEGPDRFSAVLNVNLVAPYAMAQLVGSHMRERQAGAIVNTASIRSIVGLPDMPSASYSASKGGLLALTRELAAELGRYGVRANALAPGWFPSGMTEGIFGTDKGREWISRRVLLRRVPDMRELAGAFLFLASDASSYVTGQLLAVDGGWTAQ